MDISSETIDEGTSRDGQEPEQEIGKVARIEYYIYGYLFIQFVSPKLPASVLQFAGKVAHCFF